LSCPLPLRERAAPNPQRAHLGEGVSSSKDLFATKPPHPNEYAEIPSCPLPRGERAERQPAQFAAPLERHDIFDVVSLEEFDGTRGNARLTRRNVMRLATIVRWIAVLWTATTA